MPRYKYHDMVDALRRDPKHILPKDINAPVAAFLEKIGCLVGVSALRRYETARAYGSMEVFRDDVPHAKMTIDIACGMAEGWKQYEIAKDGKWSVIQYKTVKNANLDKKKAKEHDNGHK